MTHNYQLPTEAEIENLIAQVFESRPNPEQSRLSLIESKLLQKARKNKYQKNVNKIPWWIVLVLAGGFATATWWAGDLLKGEQNTEIIDKQPVSSDKISERQYDSNDTEDAIKKNTQYDENHEDKDSPIIYQRENF